ncbi:AAA family ATPase [Lachnoclostridium sp.]|nr:AAA family ATPase [Lachnoclostridium sp.]
MKKGKIIYLNGVSSAGKTTLSKTLQERLTEPYYYMSMDTFMYMTPEKFINNDCDENEGIWLQSIINMYHTIKMYSDMGYNTIVDDVFVDDYLPLKMLEILHDYPALFVQVTCPLEELQRREKERGNRDIGLAESQLPDLYPIDKTYDITVDTHANTTVECAEKIIALLDNPDNFQAFKKLRKQSIANI